MTNIRLKTLSFSNVEPLIELTTHETNAVVGGNWITNFASIGAGLTALGNIFTGIATIGTLAGGRPSGGGTGGSPTQAYAQSEVVAAIAEPDWNPLT